MCAECDKGNTIKTITIMMENLTPEQAEFTTTVVTEHGDIQTTSVQPVPGSMLDLLLLRAFRDMDMRVVNARKIMDHTHD